MTEGFSNIRTCFTLIQTCSNLQNRLVETCLKMQLWTLLALFFGTLTDLVLQVDSRYQRLLITEGFSNIWTCFTLIKLAQNWWNLLAWICRLCRAFWYCRWVLWEAVDDWRGLVLQVGGCQEVPLQKGWTGGSPNLICRQPMGDRPPPEKLLLCSREPALKHPTNLVKPYRTPAGPPQPPYPRQA